MPFSFISLLRGFLAVESSWNSQTALYPSRNLFEISIVCSTKQKKSALQLTFFVSPLREDAVLSTPAASRLPPWGTGERIPPHGFAVPFLSALRASETAFSPNRRKPAGVQPLSGGGLLAPRPDYGPWRKGIGLLRTCGADAFAPVWRKRRFHFLKNEG